MRCNAKKGNIYAEDAVHRYGTALLETITAYVNAIAYEAAHHEVRGETLSCIRGHALDALLPLFRPDLLKSFTPEQIRIYHTFPEQTEVLLTALRSTPEVDYKEWSQFSAIHALIHDTSREHEARGLAIREELETKREALNG